MKTPFIWLGAGRAKKVGVARRGRLLDDLARAGLPVPDGAILLDELFRIFLHEGVVEQDGRHVIVPDPVWLLEVLYRDVRFPRLGSPVDIAPILSDDEDGRAVHSAGVDLEGAYETAEALRGAWSYPADSIDSRRDVLVMRQLHAEHKGSVFSLEDAGEDRISTLCGTSEVVVTMPRLRRWQRPSAELSPYLCRIQKLMRGVRRSLGPGDWGIDWIDDGEVCWIVGLD
ncbi:MAG: hypothetical protein ACK2U5_23205 [Candidatus Promineifilaceae bacterium]